MAMNKAESVKLRKLRAEACFGRAWRYLAFPSHYRPIFPVFSHSAATVCAVCFNVPFIRLCCLRYVLRRAA
jgi:hypothetical protein